MTAGSADHFGTIPMEVLRSPADGRMFVAADSLVDLFADMASKGSPDTPVAKNFAVLATTFRSMSSYDDIEPSDDGRGINARRCTCGRPVIDAAKVGGDLVTVDADLDPAGTWIPIRVVDGKVTVSPWGPQLDGAAPQRLAEHVCATTQ